MTKTPRVAKDVCDSRRQLIVGVSCAKSELGKTIWYYDLDEPRGSRWKEAVPCSLQPGGMCAIWLKSDSMDVRVMVPRDSYRIRSTLDDTLDVSDDGMEAEDAWRSAIVEGDEVDFKVGRLWIDARCNKVVTEDVTELLDIRQKERFNRSVGLYHRDSCCIAQAGTH